MAGLDRFHRQAAEILLSDRVRAALDLSREPAALRDDYGRTPLGQGVLAARRLIEAGARFVTLGFGGWDTHGDNFGLLRNRLLPPLDKAISTLIRDLASRGLLDETIVVCAGEFGRTPRVNGSAGRDHWSRSMAVLLAGGGFPGGAAYGSTDDRGTAPTRDACSPTTWPPPCSSGWASAPGTRSARPAGGRSRSSARGDAWRPWWVERLPGTIGRMTTGLGWLWPLAASRAPTSPPTAPLECALLWADGIAGPTPRQRPRSGRRTLIPITFSDAVPGPSISQVAQNWPNLHRLS